MSEIVSVFSALFASNGISFASSTCSIVICVESRSIGYVGAPISPMHPEFTYASLIASWHNAWLLPDPTGPENPLKRVPSL